MEKKSIPVVFQISCRQKCKPNPGAAPHTGNFFVDIGEWDIHQGIVALTSAATLRKQVVY